VRILYCAQDQRVPGTVGGSVHVQNVAEGLAALGHEMHVLAIAGESGFPDGTVHWHAMAPPFGRPQLRWLRTRDVHRMAAHLRPHVIMERYHNFGGEGVWAAHLLGLPAVLEVNAPIVDYPGSPKRLLDRATIIEPMRRWREWQCANARFVVTPSAAIVPESVSRDRILEVEWGADTARFHPHAGGSLPFARPRGILIVFVGAFRAWHGARQLVDAMRIVSERGFADFHAVLIGDGPERAPAQHAARGLPQVTFTGAIPHAAMPACLAAADIGVAPFDPVRHPPLALTFYWSPLKIFEYMASGLPVVAPDLPRLRRLVESGREGVLYSTPDPASLAAAFESLADADRRQTMGQAARARVEREFSWAAHCARLDQALRERCAS
jgi:glycosyltransferase involved in cell wall biosynthesis